MERKTSRKLPNGRCTTDDEVYINAWEEQMARAIKLFPLYIVVSCDPGITIELIDTNRWGKPYTENRIDLSLRTLDILEGKVKSYYETHDRPCDKDG